MRKGEQICGRVWVRWSGEGTEGGTVHICSRVWVRWSGEGAEGGTDLWQAISFTKHLIQQYIWAYTVHYYTLQSTVNQDDLKEKDECILLFQNRPRQNS